MDGWRSVDLGPGSLPACFLLRATGPSAGEERPHILQGLLRVVALVVTLTGAYCRRHATPPSPPFSAAPSGGADRPSVIGRRLGNYSHVRWSSSFGARHGKRLRSLQLREACLMSLDAECAEKRQVCGEWCDAYCCLPAGFQDCFASDTSSLPIA